MPLTLADLAIHIPISIQLFEKYDLNYYQNGKQTFEKACAEKGLDIDLLNTELNALQHQVTVTASSLTLEDMTIDGLLNFINGQHHANEAEVLNEIYTAIQQLISNESCNEVLLHILTNVALKFNVLKQKLLSHCENEDKILFPHMRQLVDLQNDKTSLHSTKTISIIKKPIALLEAEHVQAANLLNEIKTITNNYTPPINAPAQYATLMHTLKEFELDLHEHLHIENNVLFPKFIALEEKLNNRILT